MKYEIKLENRTADANNVIHPEMGRGHSTLNEASHNMLISRQDNLHKVLRKAE